MQRYRQRFEHDGHGAPDQAIVGLGGQVFMRENSQDAVAEFRPYFDVAPVLREELARGRPAQVPDVPTHANRRAATATDDVLSTRPPQGSRPGSAG